MITRRTVLRGLIFAAAAPAIVRATSLMPMKAWAPLGGPMTIEKMLRAREILRAADQRRIWAEEIWASGRDTIWRDARYMLPLQEWQHPRHRDEAFTG